MVDVAIEEMVGSDRVPSRTDYDASLGNGFAFFSARAKWRSSPSARGSVHKTNLTEPTLLEMVQHMPPGFTSPFAKRLSKLCAIRVREAQDHQEIDPATVYIAPAGLQMLVERVTESRSRIVLTKGTPDQLHIPSVDFMMKSVAAEFRNRAMGVIMTGMGSDGAEGMTEIYRSGGPTIGQDEQTCAVYGMPKTCVELGIVHRIVPLSEIPWQIVQAVHHRHSYLAVSARSAG